MLTRIPLQLITKVETLNHSKNGNSRKDEKKIVVDKDFIPCNFRIGLLSVENNYSHMLGHKCPSSLFIAGPNSIFNPFWSKLCRRLEEINLFTNNLETRELNMTAFKILSLLSAGITNVREITSILNMNDDDALNFFHQLYKSRFINLSGSLTFLGYRTVKAKGFCNQFNGTLSKKDKKHKMLRYYPVYYTT